MRDKAFASLTSGLLARKGQARPAMRPQGAYGITVSGHDDLGWNDLGHDTPKPDVAKLGVTSAPAEPAAGTAIPEAPPIVRQQARLVAAMSVPAPAPEPVADAIAPKPAKAKRAKPRATPVPRPREAGRKAAFTLRLEAERHLRLRLACAVENRSAQQIVTAALDRFLATLPDVERLATSLPAPSAGQG